MDEDFYTEKQLKAIEELTKFGIPEPVAEDCILSRNIQEVEVVLSFLRIYARYIEN